MSATETIPRIPRRGKPPAFVFFGDQGVVYGREHSLIDSYEVIRVAAAEAVATSSVVYVITGAVTLPIPGDSPAWRSWLPEVGRVLAKGVTRSRSMVRQQVDEIQRITGMTDGQIAAAFPGGLSRETVNRWRRRPNPNLREENLYRLGLLYELARRMEDAELDAPAWLHQAGERGETPYALICQGRLGDVRRVVDAIAAGAVSTIAPMPSLASYRERDAAIEEDDEGDWVSWEPDGETEA